MAFFSGRSVINWSMFRAFNYHLYYPPYSYPKFNFHTKKYETLLFFFPFLPPPIYPSLPKSLSFPDPPQYSAIIFLFSPFSDQPNMPDFPEKILKGKQIYREMERTDTQSVHLSPIPSLLSIQSLGFHHALCIFRPAKRREIFSRKFEKEKQSKKGRERKTE